MTALQILGGLLFAGAMLGAIAIGVLLGRSPDDFRDEDLLASDLR
jgi:hypothetical protein